MRLAYLIRMPRMKFLPKLFGAAIALLTMLFPACAAEVSGGYVGDGEAQFAQPAELFARVKLLIIVFNPTVFGDRGELSLGEGRYSPLALHETHRNELYDVSGGAVAMDVVEIIHAGFPPQIDEPLPSYESHMQCLSEDDCYNEKQADYEQIIRDYHLCERVAAHEVDEVWMMGDTGFGFYESRMVGQGAFHVNAPPLTMEECSRPFIIMGYNYARRNAEMLHNFGHRIDQTLAHYIANGRDGLVAGMGHIFTSRFFGGLSSGCGDTHHPPNIPPWGNEYIYNASMRTLSSCDKVGPVPNPESPVRWFDCNEWSCTEEGYHKWRFGKMPRTKDANWWQHIFMNVQFGTTPSPWPLGLPGIG
jgi:hypothetical protein